MNYYCSLTRPAKQRISAVYLYLHPTCFTKAYMYGGMLLNCMLLVSFMFGVADAAAAASEDDDDDDAIAFRPLVYHSPVFHCIDASSREGWHRTMSCAAPAK